MTTREPPGSTVSHEMTQSLIAAIVSVALLAACGGAARPTPPAISDAPSVAISMTEMRFDPAELRLPSTAVNLTIRNDGQQRHDLTIPALDLRIVVEPGQSVTAGLRELPKGSHEAYCSVFGHKDAGMRVLVVVE